MIALQSLSERANGTKILGHIIDSSNNIKGDCRLCQREPTASQIFRLTVDTARLKSNHPVQVDTIFTQGRQVIHLVDEATHFCAASFFRNQSTKKIWGRIQHTQSLVVLGPPDFLVVDQGTAYTSKGMKDSLEIQGVQLVEELIETPSAIGTVERYHDPLKLTYEQIRTESGKVATDQKCLDLSIFVVN